MELAFSREQTYFEQDNAKQLFDSTQFVT